MLSFPMTIDTISTQIGEQKIRAAAELERLTKLEAASRALAELAQKQESEVEELQARHDTEADALAKAHGYADEKALSAAITASRGKPAKPAKPVAKKSQAKKPAKAAPKRKRRPNLTMEERVAIKKAYQNRAKGVTAKDVAKQMNVSENTVQKIAGDKAVVV